MSDKSSRSRRSRKVALDRPKKPYPDFPLTPHASGKWMKKIRGTIHYFGNWGRVVDGVLTRTEGDGWKEALELYKAQADDLHAGRTPRVKSDELTVSDLCNRFLTAKLRQLEAGELGSRTFDEYKGTTDRLVATFGKTRLVDDLAADDFEALRSDFAKAWGPVRLGNEIQRVRTVFKYAFESGLIDKPVRYGPQFVKPSKSVLRKHRAAAGQRMFEAGEIRALLDSASPQLRAMVLLGINAGFGNADCGTLPLSAVDLESGWVRFPRPKTGIERRCPLWPETVSALKAAIAERREPKDEGDTDIMFVTKRGHRAVRTFEQEQTDLGPKHTTVDAVGVEFGKLLRALGINGRKGLGFYSLRHTFRTVADATKDPNAIRLIMGHIDDSIDANYTHGIDDARLVAVVEHVRSWLWPKPTEKPADADKPAKPKREPKQRATKLKAKQSRSVVSAGESSDPRPVLKLFAG